MNYNVERSERQSQTQQISTSEYLHIVLSILYSVYNLTMANRGPKHVVVIAFLPMLFN